MKLAAMDLGLVSWKEGFEAQKAAQEQVLKAEFEGIFLCLEHSPTITLGQNGDWGLLVSSASHLASVGIQVESSDRGGEVTAHEPGQLVVYPILALSRLKLGAKSYVHILEESVILTLGEFGVKAHRDPAYPGVWVGDQKICAIGIRVSKRVSMHGLALNVSNSLNLFQHIVPCGIKGRGVTSLCLQLGQDVSVMVVAKKLVAHLSRLIFGTAILWDSQVEGGFKQGGNHD